MRRVLSSVVIALLLAPSFAEAANKAYVSNATNSTVSVINLATNAIVRTLSVGSTPWMIAVNGTGAYVANFGSNSMSVFDVTDDTLVTTISVGSNPYGVAISGTGVYVTYGGFGGMVAVIDTTDNQIVKTISVGSSPIGIAASGTGVFVGNSGGNTVSVIDTTTLSVDKTINVGTAPYSIATSGTGVFVVNFGTDSVSVIDVTSNLVERTVTVGDEPAGVAINGTGAYVSSRNDNTIKIIDTVNLQVERTISVADQPEGIAFNGTGAYITARSGVVQVIDTSNNQQQVEATITGFSTPIGIDVATDNVTVAPSLSLPASVSVCDDLAITYSLGESPTTGSVTLQFLNTNTLLSTNLVLNNATGATFNLDLENLTSSANVTSANATSLATGSYTVYVHYQDAFANPVANDDASLTVTSCPSASSSSVSHGNGGGRGKGTTTINRPSNVLRSAGSSSSVGASAGNQAMIKVRTCDRVLRWFRNDETMLTRVNERLKKRFGFECR